MAIVVTLINSELAFGANSSDVFLTTTLTTSFYVEGYKDI